jgi:hypothetical protein
VAGISVGASLLATAVATHLVSRHVFGVDVTEAIEALRGTSRFSRSEQTVDITLDRIGDKIRVEAAHSFTVHVSGHHSSLLPFTIYTDVGSWGADGGFLSVRGPDGLVLTDDDLRKHTVERSGKVQFHCDYQFSPSSPPRFEIVTYGTFRCIDRLIWTVEQVSSDFKLTVRNRVGNQDKLNAKINHHREAQIKG